MSWVSEKVTNELLGEDCDPVVKLLVEGVARGIAVKVAEEALERVAALPSWCEGNAQAKEALQQLLDDVRKTDRGRAGIDDVGPA